MARVMWSTTDVGVDPVVTTGDEESFHEILGRVR